MEVVNLTRSLLCTESRTHRAHRTYLQYNLHERYWMNLVGTWQRKAKQSGTRLNNKRGEYRNMQKKKLTLNKLQ